MCIGSADDAHLPSIPPGRGPCQETDSSWDYYTHVRHCQPDSNFVSFCVAVSMQLDFNAKAQRGKDAKVKLGLAGKTNNSPFGKPDTGTFSPKFIALLPFASLR